MRGIAAIWVALYHGHAMLHIDPGFPRIATNVIHCGWVGVDLFFVLSGYIICYVHMADFERPSLASTWRFWKLRLARIYPAHFVMTLAWLPVLLGAAALFPATLTDSVRDQFSGTALAAALTLTNGWGLPHSEGWNGVSWSVGSEWFAYLTFPLLAVVLNRTRSHWAAVALAVASMLVPFGLAIVIRGGEQFMLPTSWTIVRVETAFTLGAAVYVLNRRIVWRLNAGALLIASIGAILVITMRGAPGLEIGALIICFAALIASLAKSPKIGDYVFGSRLLLFLGKISYSIYLSHYLVLVVLRHLSAKIVRVEWGPVQNGLMLVVFLCIIVFVGYLLFSTVEDPARRVLRKIWVDGGREPALESSG